MICFIPAWYAADQWKENEQQWYVRRMHTEVDDTVKQIQLFTRKSEFKTRTLILNYAPNFRHFLHRQGLLHSDYWSCFDAVQGVATRRAEALSLHSLKWPEDIEFIYSPFAVVAQMDGEKYAQVDFGEDGNMIKVDFFQDEKLVRRNIYDDRGFLSSTIVYKDGEWAYEQYLDEHGSWRICHYSDGHVGVNPRIGWFLLQKNGIMQKVEFTQRRYDSMEAMISEVFQAYVSELKSDTIFCAAMHTRHSSLLSNILYGRKLIVSFFNERCLLQDDAASCRLAEQSGYIVVNSSDIIDTTGISTLTNSERIIDITPFDSRVSFGNSQQLQWQNILVAVDNLDDSTYDNVVVRLIQYMTENDNVRVHLFTRNAEYNIENRLLEKTQNSLEKYGYNPCYAGNDRQIDFENILEEQVPVRFYVDQCVDELSASKCLREQRLSLDLGENPDLFLQISALSMGIPQVVRKKTAYVEDGKNGRIIQDAAMLTEILPFYLDTFTNWNQASIESYEIGKQFSAEILLNRWREVISYVEQN